jgi:nucleotide-binding universal stress UspA family protein
VKNSINKILVPIDFSKHSLMALKYAVEIAKKTDAKLYIVHAYRLIKPESIHKAAKGTVLKKALETSLNLKFRDIEYEYLVSHPIEYELKLQLGFTLDVIQSTLDDKQIDLVVMGTRGMIEKEEIFGSTTWSTIKSIGCPVLAVPMEAEHRAINHIVLANENQTIDNINSLKVVQDIANSFGTDIMVLKYEEEDGKIEDKNDEINSQYNKIFKGLDVQNVSCSRKEFVTEIKKQLNTYHSDLLVIMPKENVFLESYFRRGSFRDMVIDTKVPLLMIQKPLVGNA